MLHKRTRTGRRVLLWWLLEHSIKNQQKQRTKGASERAIVGYANAPLVRILKSFPFLSVKEKSHNKPGAKLIQ